MVLTLKKWEHLQQYIENWPRAEVAFKADKQDGKVRLRVFAGRFGFDEDFTEDDPELKGILETLEHFAGFEVEKQIDDTQFFL